MTLLIMTTYNDFAYNDLTYNDFTYNDFTYNDFTYNVFTYNHITYNDFTYKRTKLCFLSTYSTCQFFIIVINKSHLKVKSVISKSIISKISYK